MGKDNNNIIDSFSGLNEQVQPVSKLISPLDFSPMLNAQKEIQSIGLTVSKMMEGMRFPLLETYSYFNSSGLLEAVSQLSKIQLPIYDFQKRMSLIDLSNSIATISEVSNLGTILHSDAFSEMARATSALSQISAKFDFSGIRKSLESISGITMPLQRLSEQIQSMNNMAHYDLSSLLPNLSHVFDNIRTKNIDIATVDISAITDLLNDISFEEIEVEENGSVKYQDAQYTRDEVQDIVNRAIHESSLLIQQNSIEINALISEVKKNKQQPLYQQILMNLICGIILFLATPFMQTVQDSIMKTMVQNKVKVLKVIKAEYQSLVLDNKEQLHYRIVSTDKMIVRITKRKNSEPVGQVNFGTVVEVLYKNKNWTLIEYENEDEQIVTGWVYTRYLEKLKK
ncbi:MULTISPECIES: SH3 domain-containing protein [Niallia]|uniref:SH3 domain-containing protein n=1 Tax=Niallia hominis TaxID=3133173 RepID=A0ABV1EZ60_9BACI|nr:SH3 domain-containing protein [Niallia circulans]MCF2650054.1 SH3 domain-containing protein [Niallia circulans]